MIRDLSAENNPKPTSDRREQSHPSDHSSSSRPAHSHHDLHIEALSHFTREQGSKLSEVRLNFLEALTIVAIDEFLNQQNTTNNLQTIKYNLPLLRDHIRFTLEELDLKAQNNPSYLPPIDLADLAHYGANLQMAIKAINRHCTILDKSSEKEDRFIKMLTPELINIKKFIERMSASQNTEDLALPS